MNTLIEKNFLRKNTVKYHVYRPSALNDNYPSEPFACQKMAAFSKEIEEPKTIGCFNSNEHYIKTLKLVLNSTFETRNRILFFDDKVLPKVKKGALLDVGPGDGSVTLNVANHFKQITAIDPNEYALNTLENILSPAINFTKINKSILCAPLNTNEYDLVILSHVLYYIELKERFSLIQKAYNSLQEDGLLVIVLGGDELGKARLIEHFGGKNLEIDQLVINCCATFGAANVSLYASNEAFVTYTQKAMFHIAAFMLGDAQVSAKTEELNQYIEQNFQLSEKSFVMTSRQKFIVIKK